jgi:5-methylcytosine-specific restriction protein A
MSPIDPNSLADTVTTETGLAFVASLVSDSGGGYWFELSPAGHSADNTFKLVIEIGWRRINAKFQLGKFGGDLLNAIRKVDLSGRKLFVSILNACHDDGAHIGLRLNGAIRHYTDQQIWDENWRSFEFNINKGMLSINEGDTTADRQHINHWACRMAAAALAILPVEEDQCENQEMVGYPEGSQLQTVVNRYERDRRNRAAAIAIHGQICRACGVDMQHRYGFVAEGLVEIHHTVPVSMLGPEYLINPATDLVPLCPTCHAVAHRRSPPFTVEEIKKMLQSAAD